MKPEGTLGNIEGKRIFISGAGSGIGRATANYLLGCGARVFATSKDQGRLNSLRDRIDDSSAKNLKVRVLDVRCETSCIESVSECIEAFGGIDVLINNAAVGFPVDISECTSEQYLRTMQTNIDGVFYLTREALKPMKSQKCGHIIMISSNAGAFGTPISPIYSTSKHALEGFTSSLRLQLDKLHGENIHIKVSDIWPGSVNSDYWGERAVKRETFMTCDEMAGFVFMVVACGPKVNITELRLQQFKFIEEGTTRSGLLRELPDATLSTNAI